MLRITPHIVLATIALLPLPAMAGEIYKCPSAAGKIEFRDRPCDGIAGEKLDIKPNSAGTMTLEEVRAAAAALKAKQVARREAEDRAEAAAFAARQKAAAEAQAHQDAVAMQQAVRDSGNAQATYNANSYNGIRPPSPIQVTAGPATNEEVAARSDVGQIKVRVVDVE